MNHNTAMHADVKLFWENRPGTAMQALHAVMEERHRQMMVEGWTAKHDDEHRGGSMARAAAAYALAGSSDGRIVGDELTPSILERIWHSTGWARRWWKPKDRRRNLVRAAALLLAEIERMDRASAAAVPAWKPPPYPATPAEREAVAMFKAADGVTASSCQSKDQQTPKA